MKRNSSIQEAIKMIEHHDWNWRMADSGYVANYNAAKADMKAFVKFVKTIENTEVREALRSMWVMVFNSKMDEYYACKKQLLNAYAA